MFSGAIMHSGTVLSASGYQPNAPYFAYEMGKALDANFISENSDDLLELLQNATAADINNAVVKVGETYNVIFN